MPSSKPCPGHGYVLRSTPVSSVFRTKRPGDLKNHYRDRHGQVIVIPRRPRRTKAEIVVKRPVATQALDYNSGSVTFAPPVMGGAMIAPPLVDLAQHNQFTEQYQMSYQVCTSLFTQSTTVEQMDQTTPHDSLSFDWFSSQLDSSPSPSPISTSSSTPLVSTPLNAPDWLMGALGWSKSPLPVPSDPLSTLHCSGEWDPFTFGF